MRQRVDAPGDVKSHDVAEDEADEVRVPETLTPHRRHTGREENVKQQTQLQEMSNGIGFNSILFSVAHLGYKKYM